MTMLAAGEYDQWRRIRVASYTVADPEVAARLTRAWKRTAGVQADKLLPDSEPWWPDIDHFAVQFIDPEDPNLCVRWQTLNQVRKFVIPPSAEDRKRENEFDNVYHQPYNLYAEYRRASRRWAATQLRNGSDPATIRERIEWACNEQNTVYTKRPDFRANPEQYGHLLDLFPDIMNRRYFDGSPDRQRHGIR